MLDAMALDTIQGCDVAQRDDDWELLIAAAGEQEALSHRAQLWPTHGRISHDSNFWFSRLVERRKYFNGE
jgi:hypothetical protein